MMSFLNICSSQLYQQVYYFLLLNRLILHLEIQRGQIYLQLNFRRIKSVTKKNNFFHQMILIFDIIQRYYLPICTTNEFLVRKRKLETNVIGTFHPTFIFSMKWDSPDIGANWYLSLCQRTFYYYIACLSFEEKESYKSVTVVLTCVYK